MTTSFFILHGISLLSGRELGTPNLNLQVGNSIYLHNILYIHFHLDILYSIINKVK